MPAIAPTSSYTAAAVHRERRPGLDLAIVSRAGLRELHLTLWPLAGERPSVLLWRLDTVLRENQATMVKQDVFGPLDAYEEMLGRMRKLFGEIRWPVTWVEGTACGAGSAAGMHVLAIAGVPVETVRLEGRVVGSTFSDRYARHCLLGDVRPADVGESKEVQAMQTFENIEAALDRAQMGMTNVVRTWLFLDDILSWYGPLNAVRKKFFERHHLFDNLVPASTGVGVRNPAKAAMVAGAWAVQPVDGSFSICEVASPRQCPAPEYGSCFSRAVELGAPDHLRLLISGTASIEPGGRTARAGDARGQINLTMGVVEAILAARELGFSNVTRATAYFKDTKDAPLFAEWCVEHRTALPVLATQAVVCRDDLLFELELDATWAGQPAAGPRPPGLPRKSAAKRKKPKSA